ncbi:hypothetical protein [Hydrogenimonas sp.]
MGLLSFAGIGKKPETVDVLFYYPGHFDREEGENPYFKPLYRLCEKHGLSYLVLREPVLKKRRNGPSESPRARALLLSVLLLRKALPLFLFRDFEARERGIGRLLRPFLFPRLRARHVVVLSNSLLGVWRGILPDAVLADYQHGVITSAHPGYLTSEKTPAPHIRENGAFVLLYGEGFRRLLAENDATGYYAAHARVLGKPRPPRANDRTERFRRRVVLFTLQFTGPGEHPDRQRAWRESIVGFFRRHADFFREGGYTLLFRHHPRYDGSLDLSALKELPFARFTEEPLQSLMRSVPLHMTLFSTSIFDAAAVGAPTLLWSGPDPDASIYTRDFRYPLGACESDEEVLDFLQTHFRDPDVARRRAETVEAWYKTLFEPLDDSRFLAHFGRKEST